MIINGITPVGEVRPSQLLWTYGPGALIDLPNLSVVTLGIDRWEKNRCQPIQEARLLAAVRKVLGEQVENLRMPPFQKSEVTDVWSAEANIGVPVRPFHDGYVALSADYFHLLMPGSSRSRKIDSDLNERASFTKAAEARKEINPPRMLMPSRHVSY